MKEPLLQLQLQVGFGVYTVCIPKIPFQSLFIEYVFTIWVGIGIFQGVCSRNYKVLRSCLIYIVNSLYKNGQHFFEHTVSFRKREILHCNGYNQEDSVSFKHPGRKIYVSFHNFFPSFSPNTLVSLVCKFVLYLQFVNLFCLSTIFSTILEKNYSMYNIYCSMLCICRPQEQP